MFASIRRTFLNRKFKKLVSGMSDGEYLSLVLRSVREPVVSGVRMPGFPEEQVQKNFVGSSEERALREGYRFYKCVKSYCSTLGVSWNETTRVVDFGCGWGRISRFFFKDIALDNFHGVDVDPVIIKFCTSGIGYGHFATVNTMPPTEFESNSVDVIFAYSVFSHLAEAVAASWIQEFARILKPGGVALCTTQGRTFLDRCESYRQNRELIQSVWHEHLANSFLDIEASKRDYDNGTYLYSGTGGGDYRDKSVYGEALIPRGYVEREFGRFLTFKDFVDDRERLPQALFVLQKG